MRLLKDGLMSIDLSADRIAFIEKLVSEGRFSDYRQALEHAVDLLHEEADSLSDIHEGLTSIDRGVGTPLGEAVESIRQKFGVRNDA